MKKRTKHAPYPWQDWFEHNENIVKLVRKKHFDCTVISMVAQIRTKVAYYKANVTGFKQLSVSLKVREEVIHMAVRR